MSLSKKFGKVKKLLKGGGVIPIKRELVEKIDGEFNISSCLEIFSELPSLAAELTALRQPKCYAGVFIKDDLTHRIVKYDEIFGSPTFVVYNIDEANYTKPVKCLSYSLYRTDKFEYSITMLLNLLQTCNILSDMGSELLVRLYISHNLFLLQPEEFENPEKKNDLKYVLTILNELLKFRFFELHQVYVKNLHSRSLIPDEIEKQRLFRFVSFIDDTIDVCYSKDIDSIITRTELDDLERFYRDDRYLFCYYNLYGKNASDSNEIESKPREKFLNINNVDRSRFDILKKFNGHPEWLRLYQFSFPEIMLRYKIPAGLIMVKKGVIDIDKFRDAYNTVQSNYLKFRMFLFNLIGKLSDHSNSRMRNGFRYDESTLTIVHEPFSDDTTSRPHVFPRPSDVDNEKFDILQDIIYCGGHYYTYFSKPIKILNIGFDENLLASLFCDVPNERVLELTLDDKLVTSTKKNVPIVNEFRTNYRIIPETIEYTPVDLEPFVLEGGRKKIKKINHN